MTLENNQQEVLTNLVEALKHDEKNIRLNAIEALEASGDWLAVAPLIASLNDQYLKARCRAAQALGNLGDLRAVELLIQSLKQPDNSTRLAAAEALGRIGDKRAIEPIIQLLDQMDDAECDRVVANSLEKLGRSSNIVGSTRAIRQEKIRKADLASRAVKLMIWGLLLTVGFSLFDLISYSLAERNARAVGAFTFTAPIFTGPILIGIILLVTGFIGWIVNRP